MTRIYIHHARAVICSNGKGYCSRGMRAFAIRHKLNYEDFLKNGIAIEDALKIDDEMMRAVIQEAEKNG